MRPIEPSINKRQATSKVVILQTTPEEDEGPYLGYYDFKELDFSKARSNPIAVVTDDLGLMVDDRYRKV